MNDAIEFDVAPGGAPCADGDLECLERMGFNAAFRELGLPWHWDATTYRELRAVASDEERVRVYLERRHPHLLKVYDPAFLTQAVRAARERQVAADGRTGRTIAGWTDSAEFATAQAGF